MILSDKLTALFNFESNFILVLDLIDSSNVLFSDVFFDERCIGLNLSARTSLIVVQST